MFVSTNLSVRAMDLTSLFENGVLPNRFYRHKMDIQEGYLITRFQDQLYVMAKDTDIPSEPHVPGEEEWWERLTIKNKFVYEIFLTDIEFGTWDEEFKHEVAQNVSKNMNAPDMMIQDGRSETRYIFNRKYWTDNDAQNMEVDENYVYTFGKTKVIYGERGISTKWKPVNYGLTKEWVADGVLSGIKLVIDGHSFALAITDQSIITFKPHISRPMITCPVRDTHDDEEDLFGNFSFSMNTTTRSCPEKLRKYPSGVDKFQTTCLYMKHWEIEFVEPWIGKGWGAEKTRKMAFYLIIMVVFTALIIFGIYYCRYKNSYKKLEREFSELKVLKGGMESGEQGSGDDNPYKLAQNPE